MKKIVPIIILTIISTLLIFYKFSLVPKNLAFDEVEFAKLALSLHNKPYTPYSTLATGHSTLYFYILLFSLKTFGINTFALRLPAAISGVLGVLFFFLIIKKVFRSAFANLPAGRQGASADMQYFPFFLSLILLSSHWYLNFTRFSFEATFLLFLELVSVYFLISKKSLFVSGLFAGFAFLSYTPGRIFFLLPLFFLIFQPVKPLTRQLFNRAIIKRILLFLIPFIIIITPLTVYLSTHPDTRINQEFFLNNHEVSLQEKASGLWHNISSTALMFDIKGDINGRHNYPNKPALNPILGIFFIAGLIIAIKQWKDDNNKLFLIYFLLSLFPALMTYPWENPSMLRTFTVLPPVIYFIGITIYNLDEVFSKIFINKKKIAVLGLFLIVLFSSFYELRTYFKYQSTVFDQAFEIKLPLDKAIKVKNKI